MSRARIQISGRVFLSMGGALGISPEITRKESNQDKINASVQGGNRG